MYLLYYRPFSCHYWSSPIADYCNLPRRLAHPEPPVRRSRRGVRSRSPRCGHCEYCPHPSLGCCWRWPTGVEVWGSNLHSIKEFQKMFFLLNHNISISHFQVEIYLYLTLPLKIHLTVAVCICHLKLLLDLSLAACSCLYFLPFKTNSWPNFGCSCLYFLPFETNSWPTFGCSCLLFCHFTTSFSCASLYLYHQWNVL